MLLIQNLIIGLLVGCIYALAALGLALIFGVMAIINFAHGDFVMLAMYGTYLLASLYGLEAVITPIVTFPLLFALGLLVYKVIIDRVIEAPPLSQIAVTIGLIIFIQNLALLIWRAEPKALPFSILHGTLTLGPYVITLSHLVSSIGSLMIIIMIHLLLTRTDLGRAMRATADNKEAVALMGVNVKRIYALTFGLGLGLCSIAGAFLMTFYYAHPTVGNTYGLISWCVVALGGLGGVSGTLFAGIILGIAEAVGVTFWEARARSIVIYSVFILTLWLKPRGLFRRK